MEIADWLRELGLGQHEQAFRDNAITEDLLPSLTRLVEELQGRAQAAGFDCHLARILDFGAGSEHDAIRTLVRSLLGLRTAGDAGDVASAAASARAAGLVQAEDTVFLNNLLELPQPPELCSLYEAMGNAGRIEGIRRTLARLLEKAMA